MGYNTVVLALNDFMHQLINSPHAVTWGICHPPSWDDEAYRKMWRKHIDDVADEHNEPRVHIQALEVFTTFHADDMHFFLAGGNRLINLKFLKYGKTKDGKKTVTLELPEK